MNLIANFAHAWLLKLLNFCYHSQVCAARQKKKLNAGPSRVGQEKEPLLYK